MTDKKFTNYTFEELVHDHEFVQIVLSISTPKEWHDFLEANKDSKETIQKAKRFIDIFHIEEEQLNPEKQQELWLKIRDFNKSNVHKNKTIRLKRIIQIAASFLVIISLSSIVYLNFHNRGNQYIFSKLDDNSPFESTLLKLANGEKIEVQKDESNITILGDQAVQIDNDTVYRNQTEATSTKEELALNELVVPYGKKTTLVLSDGTKVWLNAGTKFAFPQKFIGKKRKVFLDGEAYFEVAKNKEQPFVVSSKNLNIEVLGTKFNVNSYSADKKNETVLLEGSIMIWNDNKLIKDKVKMSPNQKVTYDEADKELIVKSEPDAKNSIAWIEGWYKFSNENLEQVFAKIGRYYNVTFQYDRVKIQSALPISGKLDLQESFDEVMLTLSKVAQINYEIEGNKVLVN